MSCPRRIVVGRTGSGKSALLLRLTEMQERVIAVRPESLALAYISNSTILQFFAELGVKLDIFFKLLWRHVFTVEILKYHFHIQNEEDKRSFLQRIFDSFKDKKHTNALRYLETWGQSFWEETEYRIKELTTKVESELKASLSGSKANENQFRSVQRYGRNKLERSAGVPPATARTANRAHEIPRVLGLSDVLRLGQPRSGGIRPRPGPLPQERENPSPLP